MILYLNQMGVFNFVDDGSIPGCAVLKLSDGRKRSMSLWVEFITASGYLSARKIRSRFQTLVAQTIESAPFDDKCKLIQETTDVKLLIYGKYIVQVREKEWGRVNQPSRHRFQLTCAFHCNGIWPRSASHWPNSRVQWPNREMAKETRLEGFDLFSRELCPLGPSSTQQHQQNFRQYPQHQNPVQLTHHAQQQQQSATMMEGDAWVMNMAQAEERLLLAHVNRDRVLSVLKTLQDRHLDFAGSAVTNQLIKVCDCINSMIPSYFYN